MPEHEWGPFTFYGNDHANPGVRAGLMRVGPHDRGHPAGVWVAVDGRFLGVTRNKWWIDRATWRNQAVCGLRGHRPVPVLPDSQRPRLECGRCGKLLRSGGRTSPMLRAMLEDALAADTDLLTEEGTVKVRLHTATDDEWSPAVASPHTFLEAVPGRLRDHLLYNHLIARDDLEGGNPSAIHRGLHFTHKGELGHVHRPTTSGTHAHPAAQLGLLEDDPPALRGHVTTGHADDWPHSLVDVADPAYIAAAHRRIHEGGVH